MREQPRRKLLVETASRLFNEHGYHATGIDKILAESGVSKATLYKHFSSKDDLILEVLRQRHDQFYSRLQARLEAASSEAQPALVAFDALEEWFQSSDFFGCYFIKAGTEYGHEDNPIHQYASWHKESLRALLVKFLMDVGESEKENYAEELILLMDGAIVSAHVRDRKNAAQTAKAMAKKIL